MATIIGSTNNNLWTFKLEAYELSYDINSNSSVVRVDVYIGRASTRSYCGGTFNGSVTVDGGTLGFSGTIPYPTYIDGGAWYYTGVTKDFTIGHNSDGTKSASVSASWGADFSPTSASASGSLALTNIPRQAKITNSCTSFTDEENPWFTYTNPANTSMSCWLEINPNGQHLATRTLSGTGGTYTWTLTEEERNQLRAKIPNSNTATCRIGLYSTLAGTTYASFQDRTFRIVNANPINPTIEVLDGNSVTRNLTGQTDVIVRGHSTLVLNIYSQYKAIAQKSATMKNYIFETDGQAYSETETVMFEVPNYSKSVIKLYSVDSRGNSSLLNHTIPANYFIDYFDITKGEITLTRSNSGVGELVTLSYNGTFWNDDFGSTNNTITATYRYKKTTDTNWTVGTTTITPTANQNDYTFNGLIAGDTPNQGFDIDSSYDIEINLSDLLSTVTFNIILNAGNPAIAIYGNKASLGDKYDTTLGGTQLWGDVYVNRNAIGGTVLFEYTGQSSITLSDTIANYKVIEIYAKKTDGTNELFPVQKFYTNNESQVVLLFNAGYNVNGGVYVADWQININGTSLTSSYYYRLLLIANSAPYSPSSTTNVRILKIIGYK